MARLNTFEIFILNDCSQVQCGSTLHGQIVLDCSDDMPVNEITVQCYGKVHIEMIDFRTSSPLVDINTTPLGPGVVNETYMNEEVKCFPSEDDEPELESEEENGTDSPNILPKGMHVFDFQFEIPCNTPPTFFGEHGYIRYVLRAAVHLPDKVEQNIRNFTVLPVLDLNCMHNVECAVDKEQEVEVTSFVKAIGTCKARLSLPKRGYVPGNVLHVQLNIANNTSKDITRAFLRLKMVTSYQMRYQIHRSERILAVSRLSPIPSGYTFQGFDKNLRIPKDAPASHIYGCRYIRIRYYVELLVRPTLLCRKNIELCAKIEVGTIPITFEREIASLMLREPPPRYEDLPPSYMEAVYQLGLSCENSEPTSENEQPEADADRDSIDNVSSDTSESVTSNEEAGLDSDHVTDFKLFFDDEETETKHEACDEEDCLQCTDMEAYGSDVPNEDTDTQSIIEDVLESEDSPTEVCHSDMLTTVIFNCVDSAFSLVDSSSSDEDLSSEDVLGQTKSKMSVVSTLVRFLRPFTILADSNER